MFCIEAIKIISLNPQVGGQTIFKLYSLGILHPGKFMSFFLKVFGWNNVEW
jgi:hypothetical protein